MKFLIVLGLLMLSTVTSSSESCIKSCESQANQTGLKCHKMSQICYRLGAPESISFELCMDDVYSCVQ